MERRLIEEMTTLKGGQGRLEKILEEYRQERANSLNRVAEIDELMQLILDCLNEMKPQKVVDTAAG